jgi:ubiquinone/menaquinone biosynthesis C-methylase UbiE
MPAAYDTYDYPHYWETRDYEHLAETVALKNFLSKIPKIKSVIDIGGGYGRLTPYYSFRAKKTILTDPSAKLLSVARKKLGHKKNIVFIQSSWEHLKTKFKAGSIDLAIMVRVMHHITNPDKAFAAVSRLLRPGGYFILEFANKSHIKAALKELSHGNITYLMDISPIDIRSKKSIKQKTLPFINYHPDTISSSLANNGFTIKSKLSVSNIRSTFLKKNLPVNTLLAIEKLLQGPLAQFNFGPSIFILAQKG